jgi:hypothetical protein
VLCSLTVGFYFEPYRPTIRSWNSLAGIATGYGLDGRSLILGRGKKCFLLHSVQTGSGVHSASYPMSFGD